eukprot:COSAG01_NODE_2556_length_7460_cov_14.297786_8_plen_590_part_00
MSVQEGESTHDGGEDVNAPLKKLWRLLRPSWKQVIGDEKEILAMFVLCLCRGVELRLNTAVVRALDSTLANRNADDFRRGLLRGAVLWIGGSWVRIAYSYLQARLTWKWRRKLTELLHKEYFSGMCYYLIGEGGGRGHEKMSDADTRITNDGRACVDQIARTFADVMFSATAGVFYTLNIWSVFGWRFALVPYIYLLSAFCCVNVIAKPVLDNFRKAGRLRGESWGLYTFAAARLGLQAESIASLKGAALEHRYLLELWALHKHDIWEHNLNIWKFGTVNNFFMNHFMSQMTGIVCIGRGILFPRYERVDSIEKMATVRSDVGVAWVLYSSTMEAAKVLVEMIRTLQQLVSEVERVTDLYELLIRVKGEKQSELASSIQSGDAIAFEDVDILTPADVLLVKGLTFKLERGQSMLLVGHNGAGKSSIFRCLGGLWGIPSGKITRPNGHASGLNSEVFYIPQKVGVRGPPPCSTASSHLQYLAKLLRACWVRSSHAALQRVGHATGSDDVPRYLRSRVADQREAQRAAAGGGSGVSRGAPRSAATFLLFAPHPCLTPCATSHAAGTCFVAPRELVVCPTHVRSAGHRSELG